MRPFPKAPAPSICNGQKAARCGFFLLCGPPLPVVRLDSVFIRVGLGVHREGRALVTRCDEGGVQQRRNRCAHAAAASPFRYPCPPLMLPFCCSSCCICANTAGGPPQGAVSESGLLGMGSRDPVMTFCDQGIESAVPALAATGKSLSHAVTPVPSEGGEGAASIAPGVRPEVHARTLARTSPSPVSMRGMTCIADIASQCVYGPEAERGSAREHRRPGAAHGTGPVHPGAVGSRSRQSIDADAGSSVSASMQQSKRMSTSARVASLRKEVEVRGDKCGIPREFRHCTLTVPPFPFPPGVATVYQDP